MKRIKSRIYSFVLMRCGRMKGWDLPFWDWVMDRLDKWGWAPAWVSKFDEIIKSRIP